MSGLSRKLTNTRIDVHRQCRHAQRENAKCKHITHASLPDLLEAPACPRRQILNPQQSAALGLRQATGSGSMNECLMIACISSNVSMLFESNLAVVMMHLVNFALIVILLLTNFEVIFEVYQNMRFES